MVYEDFRKKFRDARNQYNIMALIGNGFDIQALSGIGSKVDTRYESFYHFLKYRHFDPTSRIVGRMESLRGKAGNWSDVENAIEQLCLVDQVSSSAVAREVKSIQREFALFLNQVATPEVLSLLGEKAVAHNLTMTSFTEFLGDIDDADEYRKMRLPSRLDIGDVFNFKFINFNYTTLLDDFVFLDQEQFDPHPYQVSDRNIDFHPNPRGHARAQERKDFRMVSYLVSDVVHPHGLQYTPRSLLFGIDEADGSARRLSKPYWAQNRVKYADLFTDTDLFIVFGSSLGLTDRWWWRAIVEGLRGNDESEMILYWRRESEGAEMTAQELREYFARSAGFNADPDVLNILVEKVRVVLYDDSTERAWLNTNATAPLSWV